VLGDVVVDHDVALMVGSLMMVVVVPLVVVVVRQLVIRIGRSVIRG